VLAHFNEGLFLHLHQLLQSFAIAQNGFDQILVEKHSYSLTKLPPNLLVVSFKIVCPIFRSAEGRFERINIVYFEFAPHGHSGRPFLILLDVEGTMLKLECFRQFLHQVRELHGFDVGRWTSLTASVEENVLFPGMAVEIDVHDDSFILVTTFNQFPHMKNLRLGILPAVLPFTVEIAPVARTPVVPPHHAVGVEHRHHLK
jgi:hypothetical protein